MSARSLMLAAAAGSAALLVGAYIFQTLGYAPCKMCLWQRWPHMVAVALGFAAFVLPRFPVAMLGAGAAVTTAAIGVYHTGVERGWLNGPESCSGGSSLTGIGGGDLLSTETVDKVVMCDQVSWAFAGLSMASWNAVLSVGLACIWIAAMRRIQ